MGAKLQMPDGSDWHEKAVELFRKGFSASEVREALRAKGLPLRPSTVINALKRSLCEEEYESLSFRNDKRKSGAWHQEAIAMYMSGQTMKEISVRLNRKYPAVLSALLKALGREEFYKYSPRGPR